MQRLIVIGNGMVGYKFCEKLVASPFRKDFELIVFGEESRVAYDRVHMSEYFSNEDADSLTLAQPGWYEENNIRLLTSTLKYDINRGEKKVSDHNNREYAYAYLVLDTESKPFTPPMRNLDTKGAFVCRTFEDLEATRYDARRVKKLKRQPTAAILGGG